MLKLDAQPFSESACRTGGRLFQQPCMFVKHYVE